jgi:hypothetical protein
LLGLLLLARLEAGLRWLLHLRLCRLLIGGPEAGRLPRCWLLRLRLLLGRLVAGLLH